MKSHFISRNACTPPLLKNLGANIYFETRTTTKKKKEKVTMSIKNKKCPRQDFFERKCVISEIVRTIFLFFDTRLDDEETLSGVYE